MELLIPYISVDPVGRGAVEYVRPPSRVKGEDTVVEEELWR